MPKSEIMLDWIWRRLSAVARNTADVPNTVFKSVFFLGRAPASFAANMSLCLRLKALMRYCLYLSKCAICGETLQLCGVFIFSTNTVVVGGKHDTFCWICK